MAKRKYGPPRPYEPDPHPDILEPGATAGSLRRTKNVTPARQRGKASPPHRKLHYLVEGDGG